MAEEKRKIKRNHSVNWELAELEYIECDIDENGNWLELNYADIARKYNVSHSTVSRQAKSRDWDRKRGLAKQRKAKDFIKRKDENYNAVMTKLMESLSNAEVLSSNIYTLYSKRFSDKVQKAEATGQIDDSVKITTSEALKAMAMEIEALAKKAEILEPKLDENEENNALQTEVEIDLNQMTEEERKIYFRFSHEIIKHKNQSGNNE